MLRSVAPACLISGLHRSRRGQPPVRVPYLFELVCRLYPYQRLQPDKNGRIPLHLILTLRRRLSSSLGDNPLVTGSGGALNNFRWTHTDDVYVQWVMLGPPVLRGNRGAPRRLAPGASGRLARCFPLHRVQAHPSVPATTGLPPLPKGEDETECSAPVRLLTRT